MEAPTEISPQEISSKVSEGLLTSDNAERFTKLVHQIEGFRKLSSETVRSEEEVSTRPENPFSKVVSGLAKKFGVPPKRETFFLTKDEFGVKCGEGDAENNLIVKVINREDSFGHNVEKTVIWDAGGRNIHLQINTDGEVVSAKAGGTEDMSKEDINNLLSGIGEIEESQYLLQKQEREKESRVQAAVVGRLEASGGKLDMVSTEEVPDGADVVEMRQGVSGGDEGYALATYRVATPEGKVVFVKTMVKTADYITKLDVLEKVFGREKVDAITKEVRSNIESDGKDSLEERMVTRNGVNAVDKPSLFSETENDDPNRGKEDGVSNRGEKNKSKEDVSGKQPEEPFVEKIGNDTGVGYDSLSKEGISPAHVPLDEGAVADISTLLEDKQEYDNLMEQLKTAQDGEVRSSIEKRLKELKKRLEEIQARRQVQDMQNTVKPPTFSNN